MINKSSEWSHGVIPYGVVPSAKRLYAKIQNFKVLLFIVVLTTNLNEQKHPVYGGLASKGSRVQSQAPTSKTWVCHLLVILVLEM